MLVALVAAVVCAPAQAQESAQIQATATVVSSLSVNGTHDLVFGSVTPGVNKAVDKLTSADAGHFEISGNGTDEVQVAFTTLPNQLADGGNTLTLAFNATDASYGTVQGTATAIDPSAGVTTDLVAGALHIWLGGTVQPTAGQTGGTYSANVVMEVTLTGN
jgi:hypothetical protein